MRTLPILIITFVVFLSVGLGLLFNHLALKSEEIKDEPHPMAIVSQKLLAGLNKLEDPQGFISSWNDTYNDQYTLDIVSTRALSLPTLLQQSLLRGEPLVLEEEDVVSIFTQLPSSDKVLLLTIPVSKEDSANLWLTSLFYSALIGLMLIFLSPLAIRLFKLRHATREFGQGKLSKRIDVGGISYLKDLEQDFNGMASRIETLMQDLKLVSSAVSHDLRTPLSKLRLGIDTLMETDDPVLRAKYEIRISQQLDDMTELVESMLSFTRLESTLEELPTESISLNEVLAAYPNPYKEITLQLEISQSPLLLKANKHYLKRVISNILDNASKYAKSRVMIETNLLPQFVEIHIHDDGKGVAENLRQNIFKPFVREKASEHRGYGIGLAFCQRVIQWHKGDIYVEQSQKLGGACFILRLPKEISN